MNGIHAAPFWKQGATDRYHCRSENEVDHQAGIPAGNSALAYCNLGYLFPAPASGSVNPPAQLRQGAPLNPAAYPTQVKPQQLAHMAARQAEPLMAEAARSTGEETAWQPGPFRSGTPECASKSSRADGVRLPCQTRGCHRSWHSRHLSSLTPLSSGIGCCAANTECAKRKRNSKMMAEKVLIAISSPASQAESRWGILITSGKPPDSTHKNS